MAANSKVVKFARATLNVAAEMKGTESFLPRMEVLAVLYRQSDVFRHLLITTHISVDNKLAALKAACGDLLGELEYNVLRQMVERRLGMQLPKIVKAMKQLAADDDPAADLTVFTAVELPETELGNIARGLEQQLGRQLRESSVVDPTLLGGMKLRLGNTLVDGSVASRLEMIRQNLN
ncbi:ATP synthase F1 subunit delta [Candidatus Neomarinimicrobiota bacterium]